MDSLNLNATLYVYCSFETEIEINSMSFLVDLSCK